MSKIKCDTKPQLIAGLLIKNKFHLFFLSNQYGDTPQMLAIHEAMAHSLTKASCWCDGAISSSPCSWPVVTCPEFHIFNPPGPWSHGLQAKKLQATLQSYLLAEDQGTIG